jgi:hypothetical protein
MSTDPGQIYVGSWVNWSYGPVLGATLTLTAQNGAYLVSFLGVFITFVGTQFWTICSFLFHQLNAKPTADGFQRQQQIILRNTGSAAGATLALFKLPFAWRPIKSKHLVNLPRAQYLLQSWAFAVPAGLIFVLFGAAAFCHLRLRKQWATKY